MARKAASAFETEREPFPTRLREIMVDEKTTQEALATYLGVKRQTVSLYKNGQSKPDVDQIAKIAQYFHVSADWLLGLSNVRTRDTEVREVCDFTGLSEKAVSILHGFCERKDAESAINRLLLTINSLIEHEDEQHPNLAVLEIMSAILFSDSESGTDVIYINADTGAISVVSDEEYRHNIFGIVPVLDAATTRSALRHSMEQSMINSLDFLRITINPAAATAREARLHHLLTKESDDNNG